MYTRMMGHVFHIVKAQKWGLLELGHDMKVNLRVLLGKA